MKKTGYVIQKKESYPITGSDGKVYLIPPRERLSVDDITLIGKYDAAEDLGDKVGLCKEFILRYAPDLADDPEIGDNEYSLIFADYIQTVSGGDVAKTGE